MAILSRVDAQLHVQDQIDAFRRRSATGSSSGSSSNDSGESPEGSVSSIPHSVPLSSSEVDQAKDYTPDDRDPSQLPPDEVRATERYAYLEDDFGPYMGKLMASTSFFDPLPPSAIRRRYQIFVRGPWIVSMQYPHEQGHSTRMFSIMPYMDLEDLHLLLDTMSSVSRDQRRLTCGDRTLHSWGTLESQGVVPGSVVEVCIVLRGGSSTNDGVDLDLHNDEFESAALQPNTPARDEGSPFSDFVLDQPPHALANPVGRPAFDASRIPMERSTATVDPSHRIPNSVTFNRLIAAGARAPMGDRPPFQPTIDPRLLHEDSSFMHRITQRHRQPRRRDSDYFLQFGPLPLAPSPNPPERRLGPQAQPQAPPPPRPRLDEEALPFDRDDVHGNGAPTLARVPRHLANNHLLVMKSITLPSFSGLTRDWVSWNTSAERYFEVHNLGHVLEVGYLQSAHFSFEENKLVYFTLEMAIAKSAKAQSLFKRAPRLNGNLGYLHLYDGYTLAGISAAPLLLQRLTNFRLNPSEDVFSFVLRLTELFEELGRLPGEAACEFTDNQKVHYLLSAIRHEPSLALLYENFQTQQSRGGLTFDLACDDLQVRFEALQTDELLSLSSRSQTALISTEHKRHNAHVGTSSSSPNPDPVIFSLCLAEGCETRERQPMCKLHFAELVCGKVPSMKLRDNLGTATYDAQNHKVVYPSTVPPARLKAKSRPPYSKAGARTSSSRPFQPDTKTKKSN
jgi:hypothetical protein